MNNKIKKAIIIKLGSAPMVVRVNEDTEPQRGDFNLFEDYCNNLLAWAKSFKEYPVMDEKDWCEFVPFGLEECLSQGISIDPNRIEIIEEDGVTDFMPKKKYAVLRPFPFEESEEVKSTVICHNCKGKGCNDCGWAGMICGKEYIDESELWNQLETIVTAYIEEAPLENKKDAFKYSLNELKSKFKITRK